MPVAVSESSVVFDFPQIAPEASMSATFHRTLRVPDDETTYGLPPSLGAFSLSTSDRGDEVLMPMWQSEACWMSFAASMPFLVKVGTGSVNAVTGGPWVPEPDFDSEDYFEVPGQPWLDGYCVGRNTVRQFVAMPLGDGYTVEEQLTHAPARGGIAVSVYPLKEAVWQPRCREFGPGFSALNSCIDPMPAMGLGAGGSITQSIATPLEPHSNWDLTAGTSMFVHTVNSAEWRAMTGLAPHTPPLTIDEYRRLGFPWFEWYDDTLARAGAERLGTIASVREVGTKKGTDPLPDNGSFVPPKPVVVGP